MAPANQKLAALRALWDEKRQGRTMPLRRDINVFVLRPWLGNLALIDLTQEGEGRVRLCGISLFSRFGGDVTGRDLTDLREDIGSSLRELVRNVQATNAPAEGRYSCTIEGQRLTFEELLLPMAGQEDHDNMLLFACYQTKVESAW